MNYSTDLDSLRENALDLVEIGVPLIRLYGINNDGTCACNGRCEKKKKDGTLYDLAGKHPQGVKWQKAEMPTHENKNDWIERSSSKIDEWFDQEEVTHGLGAVLPEDIVIIDVDCKDGKHGLKSLEKLEKDSGINIRELCGYVVNSGSGKPSAHYWFKKDPAIKIRKTMRDYPDIDFLHHGNYVVIEGSMHQKGLSYERESVKHEPKAITPLPASIISIIENKATSFSSESGEAGSFSLDELQDPLGYILAEYQYEVPYEEWFKICMAMHFETSGSQEGYEAFDSWSAKGNNYGGSSDTYNKWQEGDKESTSKVTGSTILYMAQEMGWERDWKVEVDFDKFLSSLKKHGTTKIVNKDGDVMESIELPDELKKQSGIIGTLLKWNLENSFKPSFQIALASAIHEVSTLIGRDFRTNSGDGNYSNIMSLVLAATCQGKDQVNTLSGKIRSGLKDSFPKESKTLMGEVTSVGAIISEYESGARKGVVLDEIAHWLEVASGGKDNSKKEVIAAYMKLATSAHSQFRPTAYSQATVKVEDRKELISIQRPHMSLIGMTTPEKMAAVLDDMMVKDGFWGRFLTWFPTEGRMPINLYDSSPLPASFYSWVEMIHIRIASENPDENGKTVNFRQLERDKYDEPLNPVTLDIKGVEHIWRKYELEIMKEQEEYEKIGLGEILGRTIELTMRLSLVYEISSNPMSKAISEESMNSAIALMKFLNKCRKNFIDLHHSSNSLEKQVKDIYNIIHSHGVDGISMKNLNKLSPLKGLKPSERKDRITMLQENGDVISVSEATGRGAPSMDKRILYSTEFRQFEETK